ncbi:hypothetical protein [Tritonibacter mobilis]|uniref:hypothetical protein n=1 Tax=Tritonibacter mobilis TaxID=379347 RepID=UPI003990347A
MVLKFSAAQFDAFSAPARAEWIAQAAQRLHQAYPEYFKTLEVEASALEPLCQAVEQWAAGYGVVGKRDVSQLCYVASTLGHKFWRDPRFGGYVNASMGNPDTPRGNAVGLLVNNASDWLDTLWRNETFDRFVFRLDGYIRRDLEPSTQTLMDIVPGHWALFDANTNERLIAWIRQNLPPTQSPAQRLVYVTCALVHGTGWVHDPQYGKILRAIKAANTPVELAASISAIYSEIR